MVYEQTLVRECGGKDIPGKCQRIAGAKALGWDPAAARAEWVRSGRR